MNLFLSFLLILLPTSDLKHDYHVGIYEIEFKDKQFQMTQKLFIDDFQKALTLSGNLVKFGDNINDSVLIEAMESYILDHFRISIENKSLLLNFVGAEMEDYHTVFLYWQTDKIEKEFDEIEIFNNIFLEVSKEQQNMHRIERNEKTETSLLLDKSKMIGIVKF